MSPLSADSSWASAPSACVTRFAPSPSGHLHLGHALAAYVALHEAQKTEGTCYLRLEDIDLTRCKEPFYEELLEDLAWLGLTFEPHVRVQSQHLAFYEKALERLKEQGLLYPCFCTRKDIAQQSARLGEAPQEGVASSPHYSGTCKALSPKEQETRLQAGVLPAWRLNIERASELFPRLSWQDKRWGNFSVETRHLEDVILARKDCPTSYHLAVVLDDALQGITLITRGDDLLEATPIHRLLQALLGLPTPLYFHHPLYRDSTGKRLAKRDQATSLRELRAQGKSPQDCLQKIIDFLHAELPTYLA